MKDGTVVNEQAAFQGYIQAGGGYVALARGDDSLHNWSTTRTSSAACSCRTRPTRTASAPDCGSCYWVEVDNEDNSHPSMAAAGVPKVGRGLDELYHFDRKPRLSIHVLQTLNEDTYVGAMGVGANSATPRAAITRSPGARTTTAAASGRRSSATTASSTASPGSARALPGHPHRGRLKYANCVTHTEVKSLLSKLQASGGITAAAATQRHGSGPGRVRQVLHARQGQISLVADRHRRVPHARRGSGVRRRRLAGQAGREGRRSSSTGCSCCSARRTSPAARPAPCRPRCRCRSARRPRSARSPRAWRATYTASSTANVISTAGDATLSVSDPSSTATGKLVNGAFSLVNPVQVMAASPRGAGGALANVGGSVRPDVGAHLQRPRVQRLGDDDLLAGHRRERAAAYRQLQQDPHVHAVDDDSVIEGPAAATFPVAAAAAARN